jgi:hypothetical protein
MNPNGIVYPIIYVSRNLAKESTEDTGPGS